MAPRSKYETNGVGAGRVQYTLWIQDSDGFVNRADSLLCTRLEDVLLAFIPCFFLPCIEFGRIYGIYGTLWDTTV